jgi:hypothetical protein
MPKASEAAAKKPHYKQADKLAIALASGSVVMLILLFLAEKTPLTVGILIAAMLGFAVYPFLHFLHSRTWRCVGLTLVLIVGVIFGWQALRAKKASETIANNQPAPTTVQSPPIQVASPPSTSTHKATPNAKLDKPAMSQASQPACEKGKTSEGKPCGVKDVEIRNNTYFNLGGSGTIHAVPSNAHTSFVEGNHWMNSGSNPDRPTVEVSGEDTSFRHNTVENEDFRVSSDALRADIHDNIFTAAILVNKVVENAAREQIDSVLSDIRSAFESHWKDLPAVTYKENELLLAQFEQSARAVPFERDATQLLLQKVIDATKQP